MPSDLTMLFWVSYAALWVLVVFLSFALLGVVRTVYGRPDGGGVVEGADEGLRGQPAPYFAVADVSGGVVDAQDFAGRRTALLFVAPDCPTCALTLDELFVLEGKADGNVIVLCRGGQGECAELVQRHQLKVPVAVDSDLAISELYGIKGAPTAVLVAKSGLVENYGFPMSFHDFEQILDTSAGDPHVTHVGEPSKA